METSIDQQLEEVTDEMDALHQSLSTAHPDEAARLIVRARSLVQRGHALLSTNREGEANVSHATR
ncbi:MAG TPA: hypothetical protein VGN72_24005 [Tepidisphaeraceae bacterium]|jgi:ElaB/YqjD/DUF883 family membrane-anchored ribosome-binding protein|nr:hypothetical protein [Tepidisphaeraceae bacterium]